MPTRITLEFLGDTGVDRTLANLGDRVEDAREVWEELAERFGAAERRQFASEGAYGSGGWAPLSDAYGAWKARVRPGRPVLEFDGDLRRSLTERPFGVEVIEPGFAIFGTGVEYAPYHQQGGERLPRRRPIELPESERREWVRILQRFIIRGKARP